MQLTKASNYRESGSFLCYNHSMAKTFFFYDLETSGLNQRADRIMQFAGQRTDMDLNPLCEPVNILVKMTLCLARKR